MRMRLKRCRYEGKNMIFIIIGLITLGVFEAYIYRKEHYPEDLVLSVASFGIAAFLAALWVNL